MPDLIIAVVAIVAFGGQLALAGVLAIGVVGWTTGRNTWTSHCWFWSSAVALGLASGAQRVLAGQYWWAALSAIFIVLSCGCLRVLARRRTARHR